MYKKRRVPYSSRQAKLENNGDMFEYDSYNELVEGGLNDSEIANEFNIDERFLKSLKKDIDSEDY